MRYVAAALLLYVSSAFAQAVAPTERLLVPIFTEPTHGAFGSLWTSELWVYNGSDEPLVISPVAISHYPGQPPKTAMRPPINPSRVGFDPGFFIWVRSDQLPHVFFNLRIQDISRQSDSWGTEIPVVPEREFRSGKIVLLNIPADTRFRRTLRIYEALPLRGSGGDVIVRLVGQNNAVVWEQQFTLRGEYQGSVATVYEPAYAEIPINAQFQDSERAYLEIEPLFPWMKIWAFVSVTNSETQHVTTITPQ